MESIKQKYLLLLRDKKFLLSAGLGLAFLLTSFVVTYFATIYASEKASSSVTDIILSNIPVFDVDGIFFYGPFIFWAYIAYLGLKEPKRLPFIFKSVALFVLIRSVFITLTHIGPFPDQEAIINPQTFFQKIMFGGDLFFSGHTGLPFLMALVFGKDKRLLILFTVTAIFFGAVVLMGHLHYSIDVLAAFFITYTIYHLTGFLFKRDKEMFLSELTN